MYGFGAGPRAIGSVAIDHLTFMPKPSGQASPATNIISKREPKAEISFHARTHFDKVNAEFILVETVKGCLQGTVFDGMPVAKNVRKEQTVQDTWDSKKAKAGQIQFRVRAWMDLKDSI